MLERKRITVGLPRKEDNMMLEDFNKTSSLSQLTSKGESQKKGYQIRMETIIQQRIQDI